jgi:hypothetical protein
MIQSQSIYYKNGAAMAEPENEVPAPISEPSIDFTSASENQSPALIIELWTRQTPVSHTLSLSRCTPNNVVHP